MIYIFTGNSSFLISENLNKWKNKFIEKYGETNLSHFKNFNSLEISDIKDDILLTNFLSEKKLIIMDIKDDKGNKKTNEDKEKKDNKFEEKLEELINILQKKPEENLVILKFFEPDKRKKYWKVLVKISEIKEFNLSDENDIKKFILSKYKGKIEENAIDFIIKQKANNLDKIISEIEKFLISIDFIKKSDFEENTVPELEESIFQIVDLLLNKQKIESIQKIGTILNYTNIYLFYNNLIANLRTNIFILKLKDKKFSNIEIGKFLDLGNRSFLLNKNYKITYEEAENLYISLVKIDKNMKTGKLIYIGDETLKNEIEKCIMKI